jgi:hypothetical protein
MFWYIYKSFDDETTKLSLVITSVILGTSYLVGIRSIFLEEYQWGFRDVDQVLAKLKTFDKLENTHSTYTQPTNPFGVTLKTRPDNWVSGVCVVVYIN